MTIVSFPPIESADEEGLLAAGGDLEVESLLLAYSSGIFPWPFDEKLLAWFAPPRRAVLFLKDFHVNRRLEREMRKKSYTLSFNAHVSEVIRACSTSKNRKKQRGTWITPSMINAFIALHGAGYCYTSECLEEGKLIGGVYGVHINGMVTAESMFYTKSNGSKMALVHLISYLKKAGIEWIDLQVLNPFTESLGAIEIPRDEFMKLMRRALKLQTKLFSDP